MMTSITDRKRTEPSNDQILADPNIGKKLDLLKYRFRRTDSLWGIVWRVLCRLAVELGLWACFIYAVLFTESVGTLNKSEKYMFNAVSLGLPLLLGLNYNSSYKGMAAAVKWKILSLSGVGLSVKEVGSLNSSPEFAVGWRRC